MSSFGYGQSYYPKGSEAYASPTPQVTPLTNPSFSGRIPGQPQNPGIPGMLPPQMPQMPPGIPPGIPSAPQINFTPDAKNPWESKYYNNPLNTGGGFNNLVSSGWQRQVAWENPIASAFSGWGGKKKDDYNYRPADPSVPQPIQTEGQWNNAGYGPAWMGGGNRPRNIFAGGSPVGAGQATDGVPFNVNTFNDLFHTVQRSNFDQLRHLDSAGDYQQRFQGAANNLSNAFANEDFTKDALGYASNFNQQNSADWLQSAYNQLMQRLNDAWLL